MERQGYIVIKIDRRYMVRDISRVFSTAEEARNYMKQLVARDKDIIEDCRCDWFGFSDFNNLSLCNKSDGSLKYKYCMRQIELPEKEKEE